MRRRLQDNGFDQVRTIGIQEKISEWEKYQNGKNVQGKNIRKNIEKVRLEIGVDELKVAQREFGQPIKKKKDQNIQTKPLNNYVLNIMKGREPSKTF